MRQRIWLFALRDIFSNLSGWPLRLRLISEAELVRIFIAGLQRPQFVGRKSIIIALEKWQSLRQPQPVPGVTAEKRWRPSRGFWRSCLPSAGATY